MSHHFNVEKTEKHKQKNKDKMKKVPCKSINQSKIFLLTRSGFLKLGFVNSWGFLKELWGVHEKQMIN